MCALYNFEDKDHPYATYTDLFDQNDFRNLIYAISYLVEHNLDNLQYVQQMVDYEYDNWQFHRVLIDIFVYLVLCAIPLIIQVFSEETNMYVLNWGLIGHIILSTKEVIAVLYYGPQAFGGKYGDLHLDHVFYFVFFILQTQNFRDRDVAF